MVKQKLQHTFPSINLNGRWEDVIIIITIIIVIIIIITFLLPLEPRGEKRFFFF